MAKPSKDNFQERIKALAFYGTSKNKVNESVNNNATLIEYIRTDDGTAYGVVKENHEYFIKKSNNKKELNSTDFAYIGGLENKNDYRYKSLGESQKHLNFVVKSINEAYSLGGVYNKLDESTSQNNSTVTDSTPKNINDFLSDRIRDGKKNLAEGTEKKFKSSLQQKVETNTIKNNLLSEEATSAIRRALGKVNEEALSTKDSEQTDADDINDQNDVEKGQSEALNQDGEKNQKDADKAMGKGKDGIKKTEQKGSISVNEEALTTKDSEANVDAMQNPSKNFGTDNSYGGEKVKSLADSQIKDADIVANKKNKKETPTAPVNDTNAKKKADGGTKQPNDLSTSDSEIEDGKAMPNQKGKKETPTAPVNDTNAKKKADSLMSEGESLSTADSELQPAESLANKKDSKENPQAPINDSNAKSEAEKRSAGGKANGTPNTTTDKNSSEEEIVDDSTQEDINESKKKKAVVVEGMEEVNLEPIKQLISQIESNIQKGVASPTDKDHVEYLKNLVNDMQGGMNEVEVNEVDGEEEINAAASAMDDLEISIDAEQDAEEAPAPEMGADDGGEIDLDVNVDAEGDEEGGNDAVEAEAYRDAKKKISDIAELATNNNFDNGKIKDLFNSLSSLLDKQLAGMTDPDRQDMADPILKPEPKDDGGEEDVDAESGDAIDNEIANLKQDGAEEPVQEEENIDGGTFEKYAESRGYALNELQDCDNDEMANIISGYRNDGGCDAKGVAVYIKDPAVVTELGDYGHADFGEELTPFINAVEEGEEGDYGNETGVSYGHTEPMPNEGIEDIPDIADIDDDGDISGYEEKRHNAIQKNMDETVGNPSDEDTELIQTIMDSITLAQKSNDTAMVERLKKQLERAKMQVAEKKNVGVVEKQNTGFAKMGETMGGGVRKPQGAPIRYEDVQMSESEKKIRAYVKNKLSEMTGKKKSSINENKSPKLKALDKIIEGQFNIYNKNIKK